jgi:hypothetical protein
MDTVGVEHIDAEGEATRDAYERDLRTWGCWLAG